MGMCLSAGAADLGTPRSTSYDPYGIQAGIKDRLFHGFYLGADLAFAKFNDDGLLSEVRDLRNPDAWGILGHAGYNYQFPGGIVLGIEGDLGRAYLNNDSPDAWVGSIRGRAGFVVGMVMPYVTAGWGFAKLDGIATSLDGPVFGGGLELKLTEPLSLRVEYLRYDFDPVVADTVRIGASVRF